MSSSPTCVGRGGRQWVEWGREVGGMVQKGMPAMCVPAMWDVHQGCPPQRCPPAPPELELEVGTESRWNGTGKGSNERGSSERARGGTEKVELKRSIRIMETFPRIRKRMFPYSKETSVSAPSP